MKNLFFAIITPALLVGSVNAGDYGRPAPIIERVEIREYAPQRQAFRVERLEQHDCQSQAQALRVERLAVVREYRQPATAPLTLEIRQGRRERLAVEEVPASITIERRRGFLPFRSRERIEIRK